MVVAGYGIYYGQSRSGVTGVVPYGSAGFNQHTNVIPTYLNHGDTPWLTLSNPYPNGLTQPAERPCATPLGPGRDHPRAPRLFACRQVTEAPAAPSVNGRGNPASGLREDSAPNPCPGSCLGRYHTDRQPGEALQNTVK